MKKYYDEEPIIKPKGIHFYEGYENTILPEVGIGVFSRTIIDFIIKSYDNELVGYVHTTSFDLNVFIVKYKSKKYTLFHASVGGPCISAQIEELHASGLNKIVVFGSCGILNQKLDDVNIIIPDKAYRDEGTSYLYIKSKKDYIKLNTKYKEKFINLVKKHNYNYIEGNTWTTDAFYRETPTKMNKLIKKGCVSVEMEGSILGAVTKYLNMDLFTFYYSADTLYKDNYDSFGLRTNDNYNSKIGIIELVFDFIETI